MMFCFVLLAASIFSTKEAHKNGNALPGNICLTYGPFLSDSKATSLRGDDDDDDGEIVEWDSDLLALLDQCSWPRTATRSGLL